MCFGVGIVSYSNSCGSRDQLLASAVLTHRVIGLKLTVPIAKLIPKILPLTGVNSIVYKVSNQYLGIQS